MKTEYPITRLDSMPGPQHAKESFSIIATIAYELTKEQRLCLRRQLLDSMGRLGRSSFTIRSMRFAVSHSRPLTERTTMTMNVVSLDVNVDNCQEMSCARCRYEGMVYAVLLTLASKLVGRLPSGPCAYSEYEQ